jgi:hypothetical protein
VVVDRCAEMARKAGAGYIMLDRVGTRITKKTRSRNKPKTSIGTPLVADGAEMRDYIALFVFLTKQFVSREYIVNAMFK